jgi:glucose-1-phosphate thymidylyltransferase
MNFVLACFLNARSVFYVVCNELRGDRIGDGRYRDAFGRLLLGSKPGPIVVGWIDRPAGPGGDPVRRWPYPTRREGARCAMKGIVLAGGLGTRLLPLTKVTNKHLLPVYTKPMVYYPIEALVSAGITEIMIVTGGNNSGDFLRLLGNGKEFGLRHLNYTYQEGEGGIAEALGLCRDFADEDRIVVVLGDNIFEKSLRPHVAAYAGQKQGARILLKEVPDPERFGVPRLEGDRIVEIVEKPAAPASAYAVTGVYFYDAQVWGVIDGLAPSARGELEITDVNNFYIRSGQLQYGIMEGWWTDAGTFESLRRATELVAETGANNPD